MGPNRSRFGCGPWPCADTIAPDHQTVEHKFHMSVPAEHGYLAPASEDGECQFVKSLDSCGPAVLLVAQGTG